MARIPIQLAESEQAIVASERDSHPDLHVRRKMLVLWSVHSRLTHRQAGQVAGVGRATVQRYLATYRAAGLDGLRRWNVVGPVSALADHADQIKASLSETPVRTVAEAADRIQQLSLHCAPRTSRIARIDKRGLNLHRFLAIPARYTLFSPSLGAAPLLATPLAAGWRVLPKWQKYVLPWCAIQVSGASEKRCSEDAFPKRR